MKYYHTSVVEQAFPVFCIPASQLSTGFSMSSAFELGLLSSTSVTGFVCDVTALSVFPFETTRASSSVLLCS